MPASDSQCSELHQKAMIQLAHKLSRIPARIFTSGSKPTIEDIYTGNTDALSVPSIPPHLQLDFVFKNYSRFVAGNFRVMKAKGEDDVNLAIWFWQMDSTHSFSHRHCIMRDNILMACILCAVPDPTQIVSASALEFCRALVEAWLEHVLRQGNFTAQARFLDLWANGPYSLIGFRNKQRKRMDEAVGRQRHHVPSEMPSNEATFRQALRMASAQELKAFGPVWGIGNVLRKRDKVEDDSPEMGQLSAGLGSVKLGEVPPGLVSGMFEQPLAQALLDAGSEDVDMDVDPDEASGTMWLDFVESLKILNSDGMDEFVSNVDWHLQ